MNSDTSEFWTERSDKPVTCSCGGMPRVMPPNERDKYQVQCLGCLSRGPVSSKKAAAINEWNIQIEAQVTHKTVPEIIHNRVEIAKAEREAENA